MEAGIRLIVQVLLKMKSHVFYPVNTTCKQLESDNKFLEEQLKSRGRRSLHPSRRTSLADSCRASQQGLSDKSVASSSSDVSSGPNKTVSDVSSSTQKGEISSSSDASDGAQKEASLVSTSQPPKKEINILEELEMEFNKQKAQGEMAEAQGPASSKSNTSSLRRSLGSEVRVLLSLHPRCNDGRVHKWEGLHPYVTTIPRCSPSLHTLQYYSMHKHVSLIPRLSTCPDQKKIFFFFVRASEEPGNKATSSWGWGEGCGIGHKGNS